VPAIAATPDIFQFAYTYQAVHRLPANVQNLKDAVGLLGNAHALDADISNFWAWGTLDANPPSDITITATALLNGNAINMDSTTPKFDDEGLYRWDVSIGIPINSYKQLQTVVTDSGASTVANVDKRNVYLLANLYLKPVDIKKDGFLAIPHLVGGVAAASKPLHAAIAGIGWGPALANFYIGALFLTDNLPKHQLDHHVKLAFGINVPLRTVADKLGIKSQIK
jgi:hypothetical protein